MILGMELPDELVWLVVGTIVTLHGWVLLSINRLQVTVATLKVTLVKLVTDTEHLLDKVDNHELRLLVVERSREPQK